MLFPLRAPSAKTCAVLTAPATICSDAAPLPQPWSYEDNGAFSSEGKHSRTSITKIFILDHMGRVFGTMLGIVRCPKGGSSHPRSRYLRLSWASFTYLRRYV